MTHLVRECVDGNTESPRQTEVTQFELAFAVDEEVLRLEITMKDLIFVAKRGAFQKLIHEGADGLGIERPALAILVHVFLQVHFAVLKDENELGFGVDDIMQADDVNVLELLHERDFADGGGWSAFLGIEMDFLERHNFVGRP
jgi:hypothetical protein